MALVNQLQSTQGSIYDIEGVVHTIAGTQTTTTGAWTGVTSLTELSDELTIAYYLPRTSASNATLKLTLGGGTDTDAIPIYFAGGTRVGTQYEAGSMIVLTYYSAGAIKINGTATADARWIVNNPFTDSNTDTKVTQTETATDGSFEVIFAGSTGSSTKTEGVGKDAGLTYNPSSNTLTADKVVANTLNGVTIGNSPEFTDTTYANGTGITIGTGNAINHSNSVTAQTTQAVYPIKIDAQGHISAYGSAVTIGEAASKGVDTSISSGSTSTNLPTTKAVVDYVDSLPQAMVFKGTLGSQTSGATITALPVDGSARVGDTYKVITAGTYAGTEAKVGDVFTCLTKTSSANTWILIPSGDEPSGTVTSVKVEGTNGLTGSGTVTTSGTITLSHADTSSASSVVAETGKFINAVTVDDYGHVTAMGTATIETTDANVKQTPASTTNADYRILLSHSANDTEETSNVYKDTDFKYNPSTNNLSVTKINGVTVGASPKFTDENTVTTVSFSKSNGTGTFKQTVDGTDTTIFTTTDTNIGSASGWSAGDYPVQVSVSGKRMIFSNGTKPALTVTSVTNLAKVNVPT